MPETIWPALSIIGIIVALIIVVKVIPRKNIPPLTMGHDYIRQQLQKRKISDTDVPDGCIQELVEIAISSAEIEQAAGNNFKKSFTMLLDSMVDVVLLWRSNPEDRMFQPIGDESSIFRDIMERNNVSILSV